MPYVQRLASVLIVVLLGLLPFEGVASADQIRFAAFSSTPPPKPSVPERVRGKIESGPMGGKAYFLVTPERRTYVIGHVRELPDSVESQFQQLENEGQLLEFQAHFVRFCSRTEENDSKHVGCNYLDGSKPFFINRIDGGTAGVVEALRLRNADDENVALTKRALLAFARTGSIGEKPDVRSDYSNWYFAKKPTFLLGHRLFMIRSEYMETYLGCCVKPAVEVTLALDSRGDNLTEFARTNSCELRRDDNLKETWPRLGTSTNAPRGSFAVLTCEARKDGNVNSVMKRGR